MDTVKMMSFPLPVARQIASDLNKGDRAIEDVSHLEKLMELKIKESEVKDSIINELSIQVEIQNLIIDSANEKYELMSNNFTTVSSQLKKLQTENKFKKYISTALIAVLTTILILK